MIHKYYIYRTKLNGRLIYNLLYICIFFLKSPVQKVLKKKKPRLGIICLRFGPIQCQNGPGRPGQYMSLISSIYNTYILVNI